MGIAMEGSHLQMINMMIYLLKFVKFLPAVLFNAPGAEAPAYPHMPPPGGGDSLGSLVNVWWFDASTLEALNIV